MMNDKCQNNHIVSRGKQNRLEIGDGMKDKQCQTKIAKYLRNSNAQSIAEQT